MDAAAKEKVLAICRDVLAPLVRADGGEFYVDVSGDEIHVHLAGTCAGCPGSAFTRKGVVEPALAAVAPRIPVKLTTGWTLPGRMVRID